MTAHVASKAAFVAALPADDPERLEALEHAQGCKACATALAEGRALIAQIDALAPPPPPSARTLARVSSLIAADLAAESESRRRPSSAALLALGVAAAWALELAIAKRLDAATAHVTTSLALVAAAVFAALVSSRRPVAALVACLTASAAVSIVTWTDGGLSAAVGAKCVALELLAASIPWGIALWNGRREGAPLAPTRAGAIAGAGALAGHAALHLSCKVAHAGPHLFVFHVGGVLLASLLATRITALVVRPA